MPAISVIIPVFNGEKYINDTLDHLGKQTLEDIEIVCVDDGSTDNTLAILQELARSDSRILVLHKSNGGAATARNMALEYAAGEYIAFLDADDRYAADDVLEVLYAKAKDANADICGGAWDGKDVDFEEGQQSFEDFQEDFGFTLYIYRRNFVKGNALCFPPYRIYEDPIFLLNAMLRANVIYRVPKAVYTYSGAHQTTLNEEKVIQYLEGLKYTLDVSKENGLHLLHSKAQQRLFTSASYYAERILGTSGNKMYEAMINANAAVDYTFLERYGCKIPDEKIMPALLTCYAAGSKYIKIRETLLRLPIIGNLLGRKEN